jgi:hypothetical protein
MSEISSFQWHQWENNLKIKISKSFTLDPNITLIGFLDELGKISYSGKEPSNKNQLQKEFNQLDYLLPIMTNRDYIENMPSIAKFLPNADSEYLILHPNENNDDDIESMELLFNELDRKKIKFGICILDSESAYMSHGIAYITWKNKNIFHFAFYDPLSYKRMRTRANGESYYIEYDYAKNVLEWIKEEIDQDYDFEIHDLSKYCMKRSNEEYDCVQYYMNAEYCYFYSLHFLYAWSFESCPLTEIGFKKSIERSYIIPMNKISRVYNYDNMTFKIILFSFVISILWNYFVSLDTKQKKYLPYIYLYMEHLDIINNAWKELYGFSLIII